MSINANKIKQLFHSMAKGITESGEFGPSFQAWPGNDIFDKKLLLRGDNLLWGEAARAYLKAQQEITELTALEKTWSSHTVDETLAECLSLVLSTKSEERTEALRSASTEILKRFNQEANEWTIDLFVNGMDPQCAGLNFGRFHFLLAKVDVPDYVRRNMSLGETTNLLMARTKAVAIDWLSAVDRARNSLEEHLLILNALCCTEVPPSSIRLSHSSHITQTYSIHRASAKGDDLPSVSFSPVQNRFPLMKENFLEAMKNHGGNRVSGMLLDKPTEFSDRVLSAYMLAGGACVDPWPERSFLQFAIALESVTLGKGIRNEITYQLCTRVAHLIGVNLEGRRDVAEQISQLYDRRSQIVHAGAIGLGKNDMFLIYLYCMAALHILVLSPIFSAMKTNAELDAWFKTRVLEGSSHFDPTLSAS